MNSIQKVIASLKKAKLQAIFITNPENRQYLTGLHTSSGVLLITLNDSWFFTDSRYIEKAQKTITGAKVELSNDSTSFYKQFKSILKKEKITSIGFEDNRIIYSSYLIWKEKLGIELIPAKGLVEKLRIRKTPEELEKIIKAQRIAEKTFDEILPLISTNITEKQLASEIVYRLMNNGADDKAFDPIVVSGANSSMPHGVPGNNKLNPGFITFDFGAKLDGWCSDMTRTVCLEKPSNEMKKVYNTVLKAQETAIKIMRAGVKGIDVDTAARDIIKDAGYGDFFGHGFGHAIGLEVHENPRASQFSKEKLPEGTVISAEPGIYLPGKFGVRIEDLIYITKDSYVNITKTPKELFIID